MWRKCFPHPFLTLALWVIWLLLNNTLSAGQMILGGLLAIFIPWFSAGFWEERISVRRPWLMVKFFASVLWQIIIANIHVARLILMSSDRLRPGFVEVPLDLTSPLAISILANTISLTPGTVTCDLSQDQKSLLIHALHIDDAQSTIDEIKQLFEKPLKEIFN
ncbi:Na+/H+ antiporter subunit E [Methylophaga thalassica]|uniref:Na+/H+ antiporter subunit E n=1 Tax=Methylophaga aminisulfidivorans TaxID=230105 RepID=UPI0024E1D3B1|nr:Na+/H+ antiporter subunit E [Methylophaga aminisulfidivorans]